jgi:hypothetical protein
MLQEILPEIRLSSLADFRLNPKENKGSASNHSRRLARRAGRAKAKGQPCGWPF